MWLNKETCFRSKICVREVTTIFFFFFWLKKCTPSLCGLCAWNVLDLKTFSWFREARFLCAIEVSRAAKLEKNCFRNHIY